MQTTVRWYAFHNDEVVAETTAEIEPYQYALNCPRCGQETDYSEYAVDQDRAGNTLWGWCYVCNDCLICTENLG